MHAVREWLRDASSIAVLTGAGVSAESGVPTFRGNTQGNQGLWNQYRAEDLATPGAFTRDPKLVWEWYDWRRGLIAQAKPNPGHYALTAVESRARKFTLITQNVDGLHELAGSRNVLRLHGSIWMVRCVECGREREDRRTPLPEIPPKSSGARVVEINIAETGLSGGIDEFLEGPSGELLPQLIA
jgi:NAD-dependent deacetylase